MSNDGTSFIIDIPVSAPQVDAASRSMDTLADKLDKSTVSAEAAAKAIGEAEARYRVAEGAFDRTSKALERIGVAADNQRDKLKLAMDAGDDTKARRAADALQILTAQQGRAANKAADAKTALEAEAKALDSLKGKAQAVSEKEFNFEGLKRGLSKLGGPLAEGGEKVAELGAGFTKLTKVLGSVGPYVAITVLIVAIVASVVALAAATVVATARLLEFAVGLSDVNRNNDLLAQGMVRSVQGGKELNDKIDSLTRKFPLTRQEIAATAKVLADIGLRGEALTSSLERATFYAARLKFGPGFAAEMLSLDEQSKVFHQNLRDVFGGLKIDGLLEGLQTMGALLDSSTASGNAIKVIFESLFQPLVDGLTAAVPKIERFFLQLEVWALEALIALKPYGSTIVEIGEAFLIVAAIIAGPIVAALGLLALAIASPFVALTGLVFLLLKLYDDFVSIGKNAVLGIVDGIKGAAGAVFEALKGVVMDAVHGVKNLLGIHSPSQVMADDVGFQMGAGTAEGLDRSAPRVRSSLEDMHAPPDSTDAAPGAGSSSGKASLNFSGAHFTFTGVQGAEDAEVRFGALLTRLMEGDAAQLGAASPAGISG